MSPDPEEIAKRAADKARILALKRQQQRQREEVERANGRIGSGASYVGYDADAETHLVQTERGIQTARDILTNAGLNSGDPVEFIGGALDAMPRYKPEPEDDPVLGEPEPVWGVLIRRRAKIGIKTRYIAPSPPRYSDPVPASYNVLYISKNPLVFSEVSFARWDQREKRRYGFGYTLLGCGGTSSDALLREDQDPYCREGYSDWKFALDSNLRGLATGGAPACHLRQAVPLTADGSIWVGVNFVIGAFAFASDGVSGPPVILEGAFPQFWHKVVNPLYPAGGFNQAPPGERYLECDDVHGEEIDMMWEQLEIIQTSEYVPPYMTKPPYPGGSVSAPQYENQYWVVTATGATKAFTVPEYNPFDSLESYAKGTTALLSTNEQGVFQIDVKIEEPVESGEDLNFTPTKSHFEVQGGAVVSLPESRSWRRLLANSLTDSPLPGEAHPCVSRYQADPQINLSEQSQRIVRLALERAKLLQGGGFNLEIWSYPNDAACNLPQAPQETLTLTLPPFDPRSIEVADGDFWNIVGVAVYA